MQFLLLISFMFKFASGFADICNWADVVNEVNSSAHSPPPFGHAMRKEFFMEDSYTFLNHGSYGTHPQAVHRAMHAYQLRSEQNPDLWHRRQLATEHAKVISALAKIMNCDPADLVMVPNTTGGINSVFRSLLLASGDRILRTSLIYGSMGGLVKFLVDSNRGVSELSWNLNFPMSNDKLVESLENFLDANDDPERPIKIALIEHIISVPAVVLPIDRIIPLLRSRNIPVLIDAAHAIGQVPIDILALKPDYYVTDCHKWLYASRGCAVLYVDKSHQKSVHPAQINAAYQNPADFKNEFFWIGTADYSQYMSVLAAIKFRQEIGGEAKIMEHNHNLAYQGGHLMARLMGTQVLQTNQQMGSMVDVQLPVENVDNPDIQNGTWWLDIQLFKYNNTFAPVYKHNGSWWARMSAQIYLDITDFEMCAQHFLQICKELNENDSK